jgi:hypothetical protein
VAINACITVCDLSSDRAFAMYAVNVRTLREAVIEPFLVHAPARISDVERAAYLALYRERLLGLASAPTITYPKLADYNAHFVLKSRSRSQIDGDGIAVPEAIR